MPSGGGVSELGWLARGVPPGRIGWGPGPLTALRTARHRVRPSRGRLRVCLLELPHAGPPIARAHAFWMNERSRACTVRVNRGAEAADVVWVLSQDPLRPAGRRALEAVLARVPAHVAVVNPPASYDAAHADDAFARLEAAGVRVPRTRFGPQDEGVTPVVYKARDEQPSRKFLAPWRGPVPGFRPFAFEDGRDGQGQAWRFRAYHLLGEVLSGDALASARWEARAETLELVDVAAELPSHERDAITRLARTLGLDFFAVDYLRRAADGEAVFLDVNPFPDVLMAERVTRPRGLRGGWHVWEVADRFGRPDPGRPHWRRVDEALVAAAERARAG